MNLDTSKPIKSVSYNGVDVPLFQEAPVLLWTNASPTSSFAAQTVNLPTGYSAYLVEIQTNTTQTGKNITFLPFGNTAKYLWGWTLQLRYYNGYRIVTSAGDGSITFGSGSSDMNGTFNVDTYGIPTRIWGVKFTL